MKAADANFVRLCAELQLCNQVERQIHSGVTDLRELPIVRSLERDTWTALNQYVNAVAFIQEIDE